MSGNIRNKKKGGSPNVVKPQRRRNLIGTVNDTPSGMTSSAQKAQFLRGFDWTDDSIAQYAYADKEGEGLPPLSKPSLLTGT